MYLSLLHIYIYIYIYVRVCVCVYMTRIWTRTHRIYTDGICIYTFARIAYGEKMCALSSSLDENVIHDSIFTQL